MIEKITIKNFRVIKDLSLELNNFNILIGDNQTGKTSILETINYALSPYFLSGRIKHTDFYKGENAPISIEIQTNKFNVKLPDGYTTQQVQCKGIQLNIKKREKAAPGKAFNDLVVVEHFYNPIQNRENDGWKIKRKNGSDFKFDERLLSLNIAEAEFIRSFYFSREREKQITKGFNTSFSTIIDDFNWRFLKSINSDDEYYAKKQELENSIIAKLNLADKKDIIEILNKKLVSLGLSDVKLCFIDSQAPFDTTFLSQKIGLLDLPVKYLGSGIEMIISLLFLETLASYSKEQILILIDEPELHLHPILQIKLMNYLYKISKNIQIVVSTHSPFIFKEYIGKENVKVIITKINNDSIEINDFKSGGLFPWSPSWGEINYFAYELPTVEFHNELYGYLQELSERYTIKEFDEFLVSKGIQKVRKWTKEINGNAQNAEDVTLQTFIRNKIHHPENLTMKEENFSQEDLQISIKQMINLLKVLKEKP